MMFLTSRRLLLGLVLASTQLAGCAGPSRPLGTPPIIFVHGNGDSAAIWQTLAWRFESNGWPAQQLHALQVPYPHARDRDGVDQPGRTSSAQHMAYLQAEVDRVRQASGARQVVLIGHSRGGYAIRNDMANGGGARHVSHAVLGGTPNHGVWAIPDYQEESEFSGTGPFLTALNTPGNKAGDEVNPAVKWLTLRSDGNDKFAQPEGTWIGQAGRPTNVTADGPALKGATNIVLAGVDHRETALSPAAFDATWRFLTGSAPSQTTIKVQAQPVLDGLVTGMGVSNNDPASGNFSNNLPLEGAQVEVWAIEPATGVRQGERLHHKTVAADGRWGPFKADSQTSYEFVITAPGYAVTHLYRSPFARSSSWIHLKPERLSSTDRQLGSLVVFTRPRGYFDLQRHTVRLDGLSTVPGIPSQGVAGASMTSLRLRPAPPRTITAQFNEEKLVGQTWPATDNHVTVLELTY